MKSLLLVLAFLLVGFSGVRGQVVDTVGVVREVDSLLTAATKLWKTGKLQEALPFAQQATDMSKKIWGENNAQYGAGLHRLASIYNSMNQIDTAEDLYLKAIDIRGKVLLKESPGYASSLQSLANLYMTKGEYEKAEPLHLEAKEIREKIQGNEHPDYVSSLNNLANLYRAKGEYEKSELLHLEIKEIRMKILGNEHPDYASTLNNLANLYADKGEYGKAELLYLEAKEIWAKTIGMEDPAYAHALNNLAALYFDKGEYSKAEPFYLESKEIREKILGKMDPEYATSLGNLAILYMSKGDYRKAELLYLEAKEIWMKVLGKENPDYATALNNLAYLYHDKGEYAKSEPLYLEAKEIRAKTLGNEHPEFANSLDNLASLYQDKGDYKKAESLFLEVKDIWAKTLGREHPDYAFCLNNLANLYSIIGDYGKSVPLYWEADQILIKTLGKKHPYYALFLNSRAKLYRITEDYVRAESLYVEEINLNHDLVEQSTAYSTESQMLAYLHIFRDRLSQFHSFLQIYHSPELNRACYNNALFFNGLLLENTRNLSQSISQADSLIQETYERWQGCRRRLANEYAKPIAERNYVEEVEAEAEGYEKTLTRNLPAFSEARRSPQWQDVQAQLKPNEAAIEFIDFKYYTPHPTDSTLYAALILRSLPAGASAKEGAPKWITLCEQRQLDALLNTSNTQRTESLNQLYSPKKETVQVLDDEIPTLYDLVWGPIDSLLDGVKTVYFAPSGLLHRLNLGAIPINDKQTLSDRYTLHQVNSTRELVIPTQVTPGASDALVYGGIQYEMDSTAIRSAIAGKDSVLVPSEPGEVSFNYTDPSLRLAYRSLGEGRGDAWTYLPGTEKESAQIGKLLTKKGLKTTLRQGYAASEESFKKIGREGQPSPKVLHIATHGFFFPDPKDTLQSKHWLSDREPAFKISDHPMIRSGLLMAGGNAAWTNQPRPSDLEDGILTAYEISQMNLRNTELVVLSACETGLGDIQGNEGVYGLQRAFKIAGAKYLLMSLWKVPDVQTQELMTAFYKEWAGSKTIPEAFREAQNVMRKKYPDKPFFWAGFVLVE